MFQWRKIFFYEIGNSNDTFEIRNQKIIAEGLIIIIIIIITITIIIIIIIIY